MPYILLVLLSVIATSSLAYFVYWACEKKHEADYLREDRDDLYQKGLNAEKLQTAAERELGFLKDAWTKLLTNPIQAHISGEQVNQILTFIRAQIDFERTTDVQIMDKKKVH